MSLWDDDEPAGDEPRYCRECGARYDEDHEVECSYFRTEQDEQLDETDSDGDITSDLTTKGEGR